MNADSGAADIADKNDKTPHPEWPVTGDASFADRQSLHLLTKMTKIICSKTQTD